MGRFINKDPIAEQGGLNLYGFCLNNGVNRWDYLGMDPLSDWMEENGLMPPPDTGVLPPPGGYGSIADTGASATEYNEGMFQNDGAWDRLSMWEVNTQGMLGFNAMEGVSWMGQAEQSLGDMARLQARADLSANIRVLSKTGGILAIAAGIRALVGSRFH